MPAKKKTVATKRKAPIKSKANVRAKAKTKKSTVRLTQTEKNKLARLRKNDLQRIARLGSDEDQEVVQEEGEYLEPSQPQVDESLTKPELLEIIAESPRKRNYAKHILGVGTGVLVGGLATIGALNIKRHGIKKAAVGEKKKQEM